MRFKISLELKNLEKAALPFNCQYELSAWIYKVLQGADEEYSRFLHEEGYLSGLKSFKLFCFSRIFLPSYKTETDCLRPLVPRAFFKIAFYVDKGAETFIMGLFKDQEGRVGNVRHGIDFKVEQIELLPEETPAPLVHLRTLSPLVIGSRNERGHHDYLSPQDPRYAQLLRQNLEEKYTAFHGSLPEHLISQPFSLLPVGKPPKDKLISIKAGTQAETKVKGCLFEFKLVAPPELIQVGLAAGFGLLASQGFGFCEGVKG